MADTLPAKGATEVVERRWLAPADDCATVGTSASGVTVDSATMEGNEVVLILSAGTAGATGSVTVTVVTSGGQTLVETLYIPVIVSTAGETVESIINYALRKVTGIAEVADADQAADAVERLQDMLEHWRVSGADIGAPYPLTTATTIRAPHGYLLAVKNNLIVQLSDLYGAQVTASVALNAVRGLSTIKQANLGTAEPVVYY